MGLRCWWFGCEQHPQDPAPPDAAYCMHCDGYVDYSDMVGDTRHHKAVRFIKSLWPRKCRECGRRWRSCDESIDHLPF